MRYNFYPRSPCGERPRRSTGQRPQQGFLSTLSLRRATILAYSSVMPRVFLSTLSLRRATPRRGGQASASANFYPRSPCGERRASQSYSLAIILFLSTLSLRRATELLYHLCPVAHISIHALLAESDRCWAPRTPGPNLYFYPRSPCGERHWFSIFVASNTIFLSTLSLRRATSRPPACRYSSTFLSTLSLRRATVHIGQNIR